MIQLKNVERSYKTAAGQSWVLRRINLDIKEGEFITIMGPSGGGKTTLVKVMLGLLEPTSGDVLVDGLPLSTVGARAFREQVAAASGDQTRSAAPGCRGGCRRGRAGRGRFGSAELS